jgi:hypothetical protein
MEETIREFGEAAIKEFGDKFYITKLNINDETLSKINEDNEINLTKKDFDDYGEQVWLKEPICPKCGKDLFGLFGTFEWELRNGYGNCCNCGINFKYYHRVGTNGNEYTLQMLSLVGF